MSDDGLGSEYRISLKSDSLQDMIPEAAEEKIKNSILSRDIIVSVINSRTEPIVLNTMYMAMMKR